MNPTRYTITTAEGIEHTGYVQGSGGLMRGQDGLKRLRLAAKGRPVNVFDPTLKSPFTTGRQTIYYVAMYDSIEGKDSYTTVPIEGSAVELAR